MDSETLRKVETALAWPMSSIRSAAPVSGGDINRCYCVSNENGEMVFIKTHRNPPPGFFEAEIAGLETISKTGIFKVPQVLGLYDAGRLLILEWIDHSRRTLDYFEFGRKLARMHQITSQHYGWDQSNYLGLTPQLNDWNLNWWDFFSECRLMPLLKRARKKDFLPEKLYEDGQKFCTRLRGLFQGSESPPALIHGDLWGGNHLGFGTEAVLIDPAISYSAREADVAMTELFGGYPSDFYRGYRAVWDLPSGYGERVEVYNLYHNLNHLCLFGGSYLYACAETIRRFI